MYLIYLCYLEKLISFPFTDLLFNFNKFIDLLILTNFNIFFVIHQFRVEVYSFLGNSVQTFITKGKLTNFYHIFKVGPVLLALK